MSCNESSDNIKEVITANALYKQTLADKPITTSTTFTYTNRTIKPVKKLKFNCEKIYLTSVYFQFAHPIEPYIDKFV